MKRSLVAALVLGVAARAAPRPLRPRGPTASHRGQRSPGRPAGQQLREQHLGHPILLRRGVGRRARLHRRARRLYLGDGRSARGSARDIKKVAGNNPLTPLLPRLIELLSRGTMTRASLGSSPSRTAWKATCADPRQRAHSRIRSSTASTTPRPVREWRRLRLRRALSLAAIYDAEIQHGPGGRPRTGCRRCSAAPSAGRGGTPRSGIGERSFLLSLPSRSGGRLFLSRTRPEPPGPPGGNRSAA